MTAPFYEDAHATVWHGDCVKVLASFPDNHFDAVITDPPYGLEFMGKDWDSPWRQGADVHAEARNIRADEMGDENKRRYIASGVNKYAAGLPFQAWCETWAAECLRVLKPGGALLAFGGTRTAHRLVCAIEDAGFEIRDSVAWLYGCLDDDTEILTSDGWVRYDRATTEHHALAFDTRTGTLEWQQVQHVHRYWHDGEMVRLRSEHTDQLLTPNHRVVLESRAAPHAPYIPSDQDLRRLLAALPSGQPLPVGAQPDVFADVRGPSNLDVEDGQDETTRGAQGQHGPLRDLRQGVVAAELVAEARDGSLLFPPMQRGPSRRRVVEARSQRQSGLDGNEPSVVRDEDDRPEQPRMEGRRYRVQEARELCRSAVRAGAEVGATNGPQGRLHHGAPPTDGRDVRLSDDTSRSGQPREPRSDRQSSGESDALAVEPGSQALRVGPDGGGRVLPSTRVAAEFVGYAGVVWCITVPHGAFIARRNGLIFATGNSGFPKSLDVSKQIDKAAGAEREVIGSKRLSGNALVPTSEKGGTYGVGVGVAPPGEVPLTAPATAEAQRWAGYGTALKPGHEPICCARKPLSEGTVAGNVLRWGTGGVNIDAMRIGTEERVNPPASSLGNGVTMDGGKAQPGRDATVAAGRWPANVALDGETAAALDQQTGELTSGSWDGKRNGSKFENVYREFGGHAENPRVGDSGGASRFFFVARDEDRPKGRWPANVALDETTAAALDQQTGESVSRSGGTGGITHSDVEIAPRNGYERGGHDDTGGPSRFFFVTREDDNPCPIPDLVNGAGSPSSQRNEPDGSAPNDAATWEHRVTKSRNSEPSTSGTLNESRPTGESDTPPTTNTDARFSPGSQPTRHTPTSSPANDAEPSEPTDTTTITTSPSTSGGSADPATFSTTQPLRGHGAPVSPIEPASERFMYTAKAPADERITIDGVAHVTVKPLDLMRWLVRGYAGPKGALILDPFAGSGTTGEAAIAEGMRVVLIEQDETYLPLIKARVTRRTDPVEHLRTVGEDLGLFGLDE